jgi:hypothetical protein
MEKQKTIVKTYSFNNTGRGTTQKLSKLGVSVGKLSALLAAGPRHAGRIRGRIPKRMEKLQSATVSNRGKF